MEPTGEADPTPEVEATPGVEATPLIEDGGTGSSAVTDITHHQTTIRLEEMVGWEFDWSTVSLALTPYHSSIWWLVIVLLAILILGTQLGFFPLFYRVLKLQAVPSMRLAYLSSLLLATLVFHWWLWQWLFILLTKSYWMWLAWILFALGWLAMVAWVPKRRLES